MIGVLAAILIIVIVGAIGAGFLMLEAWALYMIYTNFGVLSTFLVAWLVVIVAAIVKS